MPESFINGIVFPASMFIDVHAHLFFLKDQRIPEDIIVVNNGLDYETNRMVLELNERNVMKALGCHPSSLDERVFEQIKENSEEIIAIGEVGLDFYKYGKFQKQEEIFRRILSLAEELEKPVIIHSRGAEYKVLEILREFEVKFLMHSYTGPQKLVKEFLKLGGYFSIPSIIVRSQNFQSLAKKIPLDRILFETDSPFMSPFKGKRNHPRNVILAYKEVSKIKEIPLEKIKDIALKNFQDLFSHSL